MERNEKDIKKKIAWVLSTRPMYISIEKYTDETEQGFTVHIRFRGFPYCAVMKDGFVTKMYREAAV